MARTSIDYTKDARERLKNKYFFREDIILLQTKYSDCVGSRIRIGDIIQGKDTDTFLVKLDKNNRPVVQLTGIKKETLPGIEDQVFALSEFLENNKGVKTLFSILFYDGTV